MKFKFEREGFPCLGDSEDLDVDLLRKQVKEIKKEYEDAQEKIKNFKSRFDGGNIRILYALSEVQEQFGESTCYKHDLIFLIPEKQKFYELESLMMEYGESFFEKPSRSFSHGLFYITGTPKKDKKINSSGEKILKELGINFVKYFFQLPIGGFR